MLLAKPGSIQTFSGLEVNPLEPRVRDIKIEDIAHALSQVCRWTGHTKKFYSVAQHSVIVSELTGSMEGLLHDAAEAYLTDIARPIKHQGFMAEWRAAEHVLNNVIATVFRLKNFTDDHFKWADNIVAATENRDLMGNTRYAFSDRPEIVPLSRVIVPLLPEEAERNFLYRYEQLKRRESVKKKR